VTGLGPIGFDCLFTLCYNRSGEDLGLTSRDGSASTTLEGLRRDGSVCCSSPSVKTEKDDVAGHQIVSWRNTTLGRIQSSQELCLVVLPQPRTTFHLPQADSYPPDTVRRNHVLPGRLLHEPEPLCVDVHG
jgi:hypothetical protein